MPKLPQDLRSQARAHTETAIRTLAWIMAQSENDNARVNAANSILDRGWGKAAQTHTDLDGGSIQVIIRHVVDVVEVSQPVVIEHNLKDE